MERVDERRVVRCEVCSLPIRVPFQAIPLLNEDVRCMRCGGNDPRSVEMLHLRSTRGRETRGMSRRSKDYSLVETYQVVVEDWTA
jgi:hypothetical protein